MSDATVKKVPLVAVLTAFLDLIGFSIIFPLFPQMLSHYLELEGSASILGRGVALLRDAAAGSTNGEFLVTVLFGGLLGSLYSLLQFLFAPFWGGLSDRIGRRPTILITLTGTALSYVGWFFAGTFSMLVISRLIGGAMAGNLATVSAVVSDTTTPANRARGMGMVGAAIGLGFIFGPAVGGISSLFDLSAAWPSAVALGVNPFSTAALAAFCLSMVNLVIALFRFPETLSAERRGEKHVVRTTNPIEMIRGVSEPGVQRVNLISFLFLTAFSAMEFTLVFLTVERFAYSPGDNAGMFVFIGLTIALVQGGLLRRLAPKLGERKLVQLGLASVVPGFVLVGLAGSSGSLYFGLGAMALGSALVIPSTSALVSKYAPEKQQGLALGLHRSAGALSRAVGPLVGGTLYWRFGASTPYVVSALFLAVPLAITFGLPKLPSD